MNKTKNLVLQEALLLEIFTSIRSFVVGIPFGFVAYYAPWVQWKSFANSAGRTRC